MQSCAVCVIIASERLLDILGFFKKSGCMPFIPYRAIVSLLFVCLCAWLLKSEVYECKGQIRIEAVSNCNYNIFSPSDSLALKCESQHQITKHN